MTLVPRHHSILRLPTPPADFVPQRYKPTSRDFEPSTEEKASSPVRVSVWDETLTTPREAASFRAARPLLVLRGLASAACIVESVRVVYDPLTGDAATKNGAAGHAGMEGLERGSLPRPAWRARLDEVAQAFDFADRIDD